MSPAMSPFDRVHMISYLTNTNYICLSRTVFELQRVICQNKSPILTYPTCIWRPCWVTPFEFPKAFGIEKLESLAYGVTLLA